MGTDPRYRLTDPKRQHLHTLRRRVLALLALASFLPLLIIAVGAWIVFSGIVTDKSEELLETIVNDHARSLELYLEERVMALQFVARSHGLSEVAEPGRLDRIFADLDASYNHSFLDLGVIDEHGAHVAYVGPYDLLDKNYRDAFWFEEVFDKGRFISDVFLGYRNAPHFIIAVRRDGPGGRWALRASVNPDVFTEFVRQGRPGGTGDCFLLNREGRYQTPPLSGGAVYEPARFDDLQPHAGTRTERIVDARGRALIRTTRWIDDPRWVLVAQQPQAEVQAPVRRAMMPGTAVFVAGALIILTAAFAATRYLGRLLERAWARNEELDGQLLHAGKLASLGEMGTGLAHEINNPLGIIFSEQTNISDLIAEMDGFDPRLDEIAENVAMTRKQVDRCRRITQKMLQFGRQSVSDVQVIEPSAHLAEIVRLMTPHARVNNVDLCLEVESGLSNLTIDPGELQQLITNLINNALQAISGPGGILVSAWGENGEIHLTVADTGPGIPEDVAGRIFEPFFTTKPVGKGTGLGLSVCYGIVTQWRGRIEITSTPGEGAEFHLIFPAAAVADTAA